MERLVCHHGASVAFAVEHQSVVELLHILHWRCVYALHGGCRGVGEVDVAVGEEVQVAVQHRCIGEGVGVELSPHAVVDQVVGEACGVDPVFCGDVDVAGGHGDVVGACAKLVRVGYGGALHVDLQHAKSSADVGVATADRQPEYGLVVRHDLVVEVGYVHHRVVVAKQIHVAVGIDHHEAARAGAPCYLRDVASAERVHLVVGAHLRVGGVVGVQSARGEHIHPRAARHNTRHVVVGGIGAPCAHAAGMGGYRHEANQYGKNGFTHLFSSLLSLF